jgi:hypothetical protein
LPSGLSFDLLLDRVMVDHEVIERHGIRVAAAAAGIDLQGSPVVRTKFRKVELILRIRDSALGSQRRFSFPEDRVDGRFNTWELKADHRTRRLANNRIGVAKEAPEHAWTFVPSDHHQIRLL